MQHYVPVLFRLDPSGWKILGQAPSRFSKTAALDRVSVYRSMESGKRIIRVAWQKVDVKLLIDKDSGILAQDTIEQFAKHRPIQSLGELKEIGRASCRE